MIPILERPQLAERLHERILAQVHRFFAIADQPHDVVVDGLLPLPDQQVEGVRVSVEHPFDDVSVRNSFELQTWASQSVKTLVRREKTIYTLYQPRIRW